jgi:hypothetical protein
MGNLKTKIAIWIIFGGQWKTLVHFMDIWSILQPLYLCILCSFDLYFLVIWYIFPSFGIFYQEKSCNTDLFSKPAEKEKKS